MPDTVHLATISPALLLVPAGLPGGMPERGKGTPGREGTSHSMHNSLRGSVRCDNE
jgi:hypothetical protein